MALEGSSLQPLGDEQESALSLLMPALVARQAASLTGPAGSGKTTLLRRLIAEARVNGLSRVLLLGPTWRALNVALQAIGEEGLPHATTAGLLKLKPAICGTSGKVIFRRGAGATSSEDLADHRLLQDGIDLVIVEEASMVALADSRALQRVVGYLGASLLLVGDSAQLPAVGGAGQSALNDPWIKTVAELKTVRRNCGRILELATRLRTHTAISRQWPASTQLDPGGQTGVIVHDNLESWTLAASSCLCRDEFDNNPGRGRVLTWSNRNADAMAALLRQRRYGSRAGQWQPGEWLIASNGLPSPGEALGRQLEPACTELRIVSASEPRRLGRQGPTFVWHTPAKNLPREINLTLEAQVVELELQRSADAPSHKVFAERPGQQSWRDGVKKLRAAVKDHLEGADRAAAMKVLADYDALVPKLRPASCMTLHSSQGGSYSEIFLHHDYSFCQGPEARALVYVGVSRARHKLHIVRTRTA
jgi:AAA domain/UvrD-like helicase C-terminal domain